MDNILYEDKDVIIKENSVVIKCYYFPFGTNKKLSYGEINKIEMRNFAWKGKMWGMSATEWGYWMPGDINRWNYNQFIALDTGSSITPSFTCPDMDRAYRLLN